MVRGIPIVPLLALVGQLPLQALDRQDIEIHGFASQGYLRSDANNWLGESSEGSAEFNEFGLNVTTELPGNIRVGMQVLARDLGPLGNDELTIDWAYGDWRWRDWLGVRAGRIKLPFGLYGETRDIDLARTQVLLPQSVYMETYRDITGAFIGGELYGSVPLGPIGRIDYTLFGGANNLDDESSVAVQFEQSINPRVEVDDVDVSDLYGGQLIWGTPLEGLRIAGTLLAMKIDVEAAALAPIMPGVTVRVPFTLDISNLVLGIASAEYTIGGLVLAAEYMRFDGKAEGSLPGSDEVLNFQGWYGSATYRFTPWLEAGLSYGESEDDRKVASYGNPRTYQRDIALSLRFDINPHWLVKLEGHYVKGHDLLLQQFNLDSAGRPDFDEQWLFFAAKTTFSF